MQMIFEDPSRAFWTRPFCDMMQHRDQQNRFIVQAVGAKGTLSKAQQKKFFEGAERWIDSWNQNLGRAQAQKVWEFLEAVDCVTYARGVLMS